MTGIGIYEVVDLERLQDISAEFSDATSLGIITVDCRGVPVTPACGFTEFCLAIRKDPIRRQMCYSCDAHGGLQAVIDGKPRVYRCHAGLVDFSIPIVAEDHFLGAVLCGQVRIDDTVDGLGFIIGSRDNWREDEGLLDLYDTVARTSMRKVNSSANMLLSLSQEMVKKGTSKRTVQVSQIGFHEKNAIQPASPHLFPTSKGQNTSELSREAEEAPDPLAMLERCIENEDMPGATRAVSQYLENTVYPSGRYLNRESLAILEDEILRLSQIVCPLGTQSIEQAIQRQRFSRTPQLTRYHCQIYVESLLGIMQDFIVKANPAWKHSLFGLLNYLERNPTKAWTLNDAARFLGVSVSHASRRFKAYTGQNFVSYVTEKRIERAKMMLKWTNMPVLKIAKELDFQSNYFSRLFKLSTGFSPSEFRQYAAGR
ncbi:MAG: PocR ligand-binding domain-containing protein [Propionibacteriaceae bacterium]|jgi:ligand-binding sensor protein/AraC-like DNA-binding protein|nr:PocR ligand-binding domain-containing protein [Propionibacteriaceae bacterium]